MSVSIKDLIELAKAGYTPAAVKELITLSEKAEPVKTEEPKEPAVATNEPKPAVATNEPKPAEAKPEENKAGENESQGKPEEAVDYKKLYEKTLADLKTAQEANRKESQPEDKSADMEKHLADTFASFM